MRRKLAEPAHAGIDAVACTDSVPGRNTLILEGPMMLVFGIMPTTIESFAEDTAKGPRKLPSCKEIVYDPGKSKLLLPIEPVPGIITSPFVFEPKFAFKNAAIAVKLIATEGPVAVPETDHMMIVQGRPAFPDDMVGSMTISSQEPMLAAVERETVGTIGDKGTAR